MPKEKAEELNAKRKQDNDEILRLLTEYLNKNPSLRFSQALLNLNIVKREEIYVDSSIPIIEWKNDYYTEPEVILKRMKE